MVDQEHVRRQKKPPQRYRENKEYIEPQKIRTESVSSRKEELIVYNDAESSNKENNELCPLDIKQQSQLRLFQQIVEVEAEPKGIEQSKLRTLRQ